MMNVIYLEKQLSEFSIWKMENVSYTLALVLAVEKENVVLVLCMMDVNGFNQIPIQIDPNPKV